MEKVQADWSLLPAEILSKIFRLAIDEQSHKESTNLILVCKSWLISAQLVLYSNITINSLPQLRKFYCSVAFNAYLGEIVKCLNLRFRIPETNETKKESRLDIFTFLSFLLSEGLPNLEELNEDALHSYTSTVNALFDGRLKKLKVLSGPVFECRENELANYITCVSLMKDRLENVSISDNFSFEEQISIDEVYFNRLYNKLDQFNKLNTICIHKKTNDTILVLENIVGACKSLKDITLNIRPPDNIRSPDSYVSTDKISIAIPSANIKSLKIRLKTLNDLILLLYIMHKFPQLHTFTFKSKIDTASVHHLDEQTLTRLLNYLYNIESYFISNIKVDFTNIANFIGEHWKATSEHGSKRVEFILKRTDSEGVQLLFDFAKRKGSSITSTIFKYFVPNLDWQYINGFLKKKW